jgi:single-strand DNA-binding protein
MLNVVTIIGRMVKDPELKTTKSGKSVCSFRIANDSGYKDASGQSQTNWLDVTAWGKTAEFVCKYFPKGALIAFDGRLQTRQYQDKNGQNRTAVEIVAQNVSFCGSKESTSPAQQNAAQRPAAPSQRTQGEPVADYALIEDDGDLPF